MEPVTYTELRKNLKKIMDDSLDKHEPVVIKRAKGESMVILPLSVYEAIKETAYLLGHEANAKHLRKSLASLEAGQAIARHLIEP